MKANVFGFIDHTHPAASEFFDDVIMGDSFADQGRPVGANYSRRKRRSFTAVLVGEQAGRA
jgi:hypothetical protein